MMLKARRTGAAIKLLEATACLKSSLKLSDADRKSLAGIIKKYEGSSALGDRETLIADSRYRYIEKVVSSSVKKGRSPESLTTSDKIDKIVTHRIFAIPVFLLMMLIMFGITFGPLGSFLQDGVAYLIEEYLATGIDSLLSSLGVALWLKSLVVDGIISGVGGVLTSFRKFGCFSSCLS